MKIQVLTFKCDCPAEASHPWKSGLFGLALAEFPGVIAQSPVFDGDHNLHGEVLVWEDQAALARFRHSELYARLVMDPSHEDLVDEEFSVAAGSPLVTSPALLAA